MNIRIYTKKSFEVKMKDNGLTCYSLAKILNSSVSTMYKIKDSKVSVKFNEVKKYLEVLHCNFDDVFYIK